MDRRSPSSWISRSTGAWVLLTTVPAFLLGSLGGLAAGIAAAITGGLFWWALVERPGKFTYRRGVLFGFVAQLAAYPVLYLVSGLLGLQAGVGDQPTFDLQAATRSVEELVNVLALDMIGWVIVSSSFGQLITLPLGIAGGLVLAALRRRVLPGDSESGDTQK